MSAVQNAPDTYNSVRVAATQNQRGSWQIRTIVSTFSRAGKLLARLQRFKTFQGTEYQAEMERLRVLWAARGRPWQRVELDISSDLFLTDLAHGWAEERARRAKQPLSAATIRVMRSRVNNLVIPAWGNLKAEDICWWTLTKGQNWLREQGYSPHTVRHATLLVSEIVTDAAEHGRAYLPGCDLVNFRAQAMDF
jgi:hypothetical protein